MKKEKREKLQARGWKVTTTAEFLQLTPEEEKIIELRLALSKALKTARIQAGQTQVQTADLLDSSQSRVAKMEAADGSVSIDLLIRSLFGLGVDNRQLSEIIAAETV